MFVLSLFTIAVIFTPSSSLQITNTTGGNSGATSDPSSSTISEFTSPRKAMNLPVRMLRYARNPGFFGQTNVLTRIDEALFPESDARQLRSFVLCGLGGIGKTEIANEFVWSRKTRFNAIFWVSADTTQKLAAGFSDIARELGLEDPDSNNDPVGTREIVKD